MYATVAAAVDKVGDDEDTDLARVFNVVTLAEASLLTGVVRTFTIPVTEFVVEDAVAVAKFVEDVVQLAEVLTHEAKALPSALMVFAFGAVEDKEGGILVFL